MNEHPVETVSIVGAGFMGAQIGFQCAASGLTTWIVDSSSAALERAQRSHAEELARRGLSLAETAQIQERLHWTQDLAEGVATADLILEAIPENLEAKRALFARLEPLCRPEALLATNSSAIRISKLEDVAQHRERLLNMHFFPMVWEKPVVELMRGSATSERTLERARQFARRLGMTPLIVQKESTGFLFNRVWRAIKKEVLHLVEDGVASHEDVDRAWMIVMGTAIGPFGFMDRIGLDIIRDVELIYYGESGDPSDAPPSHLLDRIARGELGVKTGQGFYAYPNPAFESPGWLRGETAPATSDAAANPLVGNWRLRSYTAQNADGDTMHPLTENPLGILSYDADGRMSVTLTQTDRPRFASDNAFQSAEAERAAAFDTYFSYCGTYIVHPDHVVHHIELCSFPNWNGTEQTRLYALEGDILTLRTPPMPGKETNIVATLTWERITPGK